MMTRKDYVAISDLLYSYRPIIDEMAFELMVHEFANLMEEDNERFMRDRFVRACKNGND